MEAATNSSTAKTCGSNFALERVDSALPGKGNSGPSARLIHEAARGDAILIFFHESEFEVCQETNRIPHVAGRGFDRSVAKTAAKTATELRWQSADSVSMPPPSITYRWRDNSSRETPRARGPCAPALGEPRPSRVRGRAGAPGPDSDPRAPSDRRAPP